MKQLTVPLMIVVSGAFMAIAWLAHLRIRHYGFWIALLMSWAIVLPEYLLNVGATRWGYGTYSGAQMAAIHLSSGVVCVMLVSRFLLNEEVFARQIAGFAFLLVGMLLILYRR
jgi:uncharacterized protein (DUF486 family)